MSKDVDERVTGLGSYLFGIRFSKSIPGVVEESVDRLFYLFSSLDFSSYSVILTSLSLDFCISSFSNLSNTSLGA